MHTHLSDGEAQVERYSGVFRKQWSNGSGIASVMNLTHKYGFSRTDQSKPWNLDNNMLQSNPVL